VAKNTAKSKTNFCGTGPYNYERVKEVKVAIGPDGTNGLLPYDYYFLDNFNTQTMFGLSFALTLTQCVVERS